MTAIEITFAFLLVLANGFFAASEVRDRPSSPVVAEALTNVVKHAQTSRAEVRASLNGGALRVEVRDDGIGGATPEGGSGLVGLEDRAEAAGGELNVESPRVGAR